MSKKYRSKPFGRPKERKSSQSSPTKIVLFNKPYGVLTQFTDQQGRKTLKDFIDIPDIYAAGRLDRDSEGLLILTNDGKLQNKLASPKHKAQKNYWVQVEGQPKEQDLDKLRQGVILKDGLTLPAEIQIIPAPDIWSRIPPVRKRETIPTTWLDIGIKEGKNRQVRRMTANIGHPTLRLIRYKIGEWRLQGLNPGELIEIE
jgi:23S rRNA pseudouridine2457 synthase